MKTREQMRTYLRYYSLGFRYQDLDDFIIDKNNCCFCGLCASICDAIGIKENKEVFLEHPEKCSECSKCLNYCTRSYFPDEVFKKELFSSKASKNDLLGYYEKATLAKSTDKAILEVAQNAGVTTMLLIHALNTGLIDGALLTGKDEDWSPKPVVARTPEEILAAAGSIYSMVPSLRNYNTAVKEYKLEKLAFVCMPCQIQAVRKIQLCNPLSDNYGKITLIIGLFCSSNFSYDLLKNKVEEVIDKPINTVEKFDISRGKFFIYLKDGSEKQIPIKDTKVLRWSSCHHCKDYSAEYADISVGSVGAPSDDWNSVLIRTDVGAKLFNDTVKAKKISVDDKIELSRIEREAERKKTYLKEIENNLLNIENYKEFMDLILSDK